MVVCNSGPVSTSEVLSFTGGNEEVGDSTTEGEFGNADRSSLIRLESSAIYRNITRPTPI